MGMKPEEETSIDRIVQVLNLIDMRLAAIERWIEDIDALSEGDELVLYEYELHRDKRKDH